MTTVVLKANRRNEHGKGSARRLRASGKIPSVAYGSGMPTANLAIEREAVRAILTSPRGRNTLIRMEIEAEQGFDVMVKEYNVHPLTRKLLHADFVVVAADKPIIVEVPFRTVGKSQGEAEGGTLLTNVRTMTVRCLPHEIPDEITHEVSALKIDDVVKVKDLTMTGTFEVLMAPEKKVISVVPPRVLEAAELPPTEGVPAEGEAAAGEEGAEAKAEGEGDVAEKPEKGDKKKKDKD